MNLPRVASVALWFLPALACTKQPTAAECDQAWHHVADILQAVAREDMQRIGAPLPEQAKRMMAEHMGKSLQQAESSPMGAQIHAAQLQACQAKPLARAHCILNATTVEDLVNVCQMKASKEPSVM